METKIAKITQIIMNTKSLEDLIKHYPTLIQLSELGNPAELDQRISCIDTLFQNIIGVNEDSIEFCPNEEPADSAEILAWLWIAFPQFSTDMIKFCKNTELIKLLNAYNEGDLENWWQYISE